MDKVIEKIKGWYAAALAFDKAYPEVVVAAAIFAAWFLGRVRFPV